MSWALQALGLPADADERAIKRAYATRLKVTRPDDDPTGFQQLHETYQAALAWARQRALATDAGDDGAADAPAWTRHSEVATALAVVQDAPPTAVSDHAPREPHDRGDRHAPTHATAPTRERTVASPPVDVSAIDIGQVSQRVLQQARVLAPAALQHWLLTQPELWSLESKPLIGASLQRQMFEQMPALSGDSHDVLADFFDWEHAPDAPDPFLVQQARLRMHRHWLLQPAGYGELSRELGRRGDAHASVPAVRTLIGWLRQAPSTGTEFATMLWPPRIKRVRRLLDLIGYTPAAGKPPPPLDRERANGWYLASANQGFNPVIALLGLARSCIVAGGILLLSLLLAMFDRSPAAGISPTLQWGLYGAAAAVGWWIGWYGFTSLLRWQARANADPLLAHPTLQFLFIPTLAAIAAALVALDHVLPARAIALPLLGLALWRWARRAGWHPRFRWDWGWAWGLLFALKAGALIVALLMIYPLVALVAAATAWLGDWFTQFGVATPPRKR